ncbi:hypothetical protein [Vibrio sp. ER1A]|nr:hypothetical protein [Vibrio sp. ER1A]
MKICKETIIQEYVDGSKQTAIAAKYGITQAYVSMILKRNNITTRDKRRK